MLVGCEQYEKQSTEEPVLSGTILSSHFVLTLYPQDLNSNSPYRLP